jgi:hypothetical protein
MSRTNEEILDNYPYDENGRYAVFTDVDVLSAMTASREDERERIRGKHNDLLKCLKQLMLSIEAHPDYLSGEEGDEWHDLIDVCDEIVSRSVFI